MSLHICDVVWDLSMMLQPTGYEDFLTSECSNFRTIFAILTYNIRRPAIDWRTCLKLNKITFIPFKNLSETVPLETGTFLYNRCPFVLQKQAYLETAETIVWCRAQPEMVCCTIKRRTEAEKITFFTKKVIRKVLSLCNSLSKSILK
jgi:hypothetical protein